jgi:hypothetical protein
MRWRVTQRTDFYTHICRFLSKMQDRGASLIGRILKLTFAINASCLAKERCIPDIAPSEEIYIYIYIYIYARRTVL